MSRVFAIAPYEGLKTLILSVAPEFPSLDIRCEVGNLSEGKGLASMAIEQSYDVILSRGGTLGYIRSSTTVPVVEVGVSGHDMLNSIALSQGYSGKKAVVGFERITRGYASICKLLNYDVEIYTIQLEDELPKTFRELQARGINVVIGDTITTQVARQIGMNGLLITSGEESVREALRRVEQIDGFMDGLERQRRLAENLLSNVQPFLCALDKSGNVQYGRFPDEIDRQTLVSALASHGDTLKKTGLDVMIFRNPNGMRVRAEGSSFWFDDEELFVWKLSVDSGASEKAPKGIRIQNSEEIPIVTPATFSTNSEVFGTLLKRLDILGKTGRSVLLVGERGLGKVRLGNLVYCSGRRLPLITVDCSCADAAIHPFLAKVVKNTDLGYTILWQHMDALDIEVQRTLAADEALLKRFRHIATAERDLFEMEADERFDGGLLKSIDFVRMAVPPLRERPEDLENIVGLMIGELNEKIGKQIVGVTRSAAEFIKKQSWFGNEDRLKEVLELAMLETNDLYIQRKTIETLAVPSQSNINNYNITSDMTLDAIEKEIILYVLRDENMNQVKAAQRLGISRTTLWRKIR